MGKVRDDLKKHKRKKNHPQPNHFKTHRVSSHCSFLIYEIGLLFHFSEFESMTQNELKWWARNKTAIYLLLYYASSERGEAAMAWCPAACSGLSYLGYPRCILP